MSSAFRNYETEELVMSGMSLKARNYECGRKASGEKTGIFYQIEEVINTMFDVRCSQKKKWGYDWYDYARYGYYNKAREELVTKPACLAKSVALQCIADLEYLRDALEKLERGAK